MKRTLFKSVLLALAASSVFSSCTKPSDNVVNPQGDNELVTKVVIAFEDEDGNKKLFTWSQINQAQNPVITYDTLLAGKTYNGEILLLDETKTPVDTISHEFEESALKLEHQFFYTAQPADLLTFSYAPGDIDANKVPVGIAPVVKAEKAGIGSYNVILKHQPGVKPTSGNGDKTKGSTDLDITFPVKVK